MMTTLKIPGSLLISVCILLFSSAPSGAFAQRPNIIYIMADDMGYSDIGCYGGEVHTPNIDQLAANGIKLRSFYNNARCCPTRASLLTGQYPHTVGMGDMVTKAKANPPKGPYQGYLDDRYPTIAEDLQKAGYRTLMSGKWHVGEKEDYWPMKRGFQRYFGLISGASSYYEIIPQEKGVRHVVLGDTDYDIPDTGFYMTDAFTDHANQFLDEHKKEHAADPFFLYLAYTAPHFPLHAYEADIAKYEAMYMQGWDIMREKRFARMQKLGLVDKRYQLTERPSDIPAWNSEPDKKKWARKMAVYAAMIDRMDQNIGRLIQTLKKNGQYENTLIVFIADNGGCAENVDNRHFNDPTKKIGERGSYVTYDVPWANVSNTPFKKYKRFLHEGGMISPCIMQWPAKIKPRAGYSDNIGFITDLLPTALELAGVPAANLPGQSLSYIWKGNKPVSRTYCWEHEGNEAIRKGNWKLVRDLEDPAWELYDLSKDPAETKDLALSEKWRVQEMITEYQQWANKVGVKEVKAVSKISYIPEFSNENHPEIGYWFISPDLLVNEKYLPNVDSIATKCNYTMLFLTARAGANFYDYDRMHPVFKKLVEEAHKKGLKVGLQLWGNYKDKTVEGSQRMIVENEVQLDGSGNASYTAKAKYIRFPDRLLKSDLFKVYAFKKTGDGFYDPSTLQDITGKCETVLPDKETVQVRIRGGEPVKGLTACIMTQQYCSQSSMWDDVEINGFVEAMTRYGDVPFDGFALDEYGNKFIERIFDKNSPTPFRGRWYSTAMATAYAKEKGKSLERTLFDGRYAPEGKPEVRIKAINEYMEFMREGPLRVENAVYNKSREIYGTAIFNGIHDTYHNSLINDEIWANGIAWWRSPRAYGQTDEKTFTPTQMGVAMAHPMNALYNQYYDAELSPVVVKALYDLRYGIRTHYHALNDKRPLRFDLEFPEAIDSINKIENGARLLNKFNPSLPEVKLLVIFGMEALSNWYPDHSARGVYDINDKLGIEEKAVEIWNAGYLNALVPSDLIVNHTLKLNKEGKPEMNGHVFDAVIYLNPQYAREPVLTFLEEYEKRGGKLMIEGTANRDFEGNLISRRFRSIYAHASVTGYSVENIGKLAVQKNFMPDGCKNEDGSYVFTDLPSLRTNKSASFSVSVDGDVYSATYKVLAVIKAGKKTGLEKFAATGFTELRRNQEVLLSFKEPVDVFIEKRDGKFVITVADKAASIKPVVNKL